ncbi:MAG: hypothetical protein KIT84_25775 [Labilithrix sp.]|nr:hypothetical protein [Labilithrix sp.]MCW5814463.1 hypothetical protein [Labilithrix sp.]
MLASLVVPARAAASPEDLFGYGARTSAMGATGATHGTGAESAYHNPALGSLTRRNAVTLGLGGAAFALTPRTDAPAAKGVLAGAAIPIPFGGFLRDRVGVSAALYMPRDLLVRARVLYPETPQFPLLTDRAQSVTLRAGFGVDVGWGVRAGLGVATLAALSGSVVATAEGSSVENQLVTTYAPTIGATWEHGAGRDALGRPSVYRVGVVFRGELDARFAVTVDGSKLTTLPIPVFDIAGLAQYDPAQIVVEVARTDARSTFALQGVYKRWRDFPGLVEPTLVCSPGVTTCGLAPPEIAWRDTFVVRAGAEHGIDLAPGVVLRARAGGWVETSALPGSLPESRAFDPATKTVVAVPTRYFDGTRLVVTGGFGLGLRHVDLDTFVQRHWVLDHGRITAFGLTGTVRF